MARLCVGRAELSAFGVVTIMHHVIVKKALLVWAGTQQSTQLRFSSPLFITSSSPAARRTISSLFVVICPPDGSLLAIHLVFRIMYIQFGLCFVRLSPGGIAKLLCRVTGVRRCMETSLICSPTESPPVHFSISTVASRVSPPSLLSLSLSPFPPRLQ